MKHYIYTTTIFLLLAGSLQGQTINGRLFSKRDSTAIANATVSIFNSNKKTTSNLNGFFSIQANSPMDTLVISHAEFSFFLLPGNDIVKELNIIFLEPKLLALSEVTVFSTGYELLNQKTATGAYEIINTDLLLRNVSPNIIDRLNGITNSLLYDRRFGLPIIRGISTLTSSIQSPLIILDNFPYEGNIQNINPNDIDEITILKDAAATAIWGAKAGNGVIVITTKRGKQNQKLKIGFTSNITVTDKRRLFDDKNFLNSKNFIEVEKYLFDRGFYNNDLNNRITFPVISPVVETLNAQRAGTISGDVANQIIADLEKQDIRSDYLNYLHRKSINQQYALSITGGGSNIGYSLFIGKDHSDRSLIGDSYDRVVLKNSNTYRAKKNLDLLLGITFTQAKTINNSVGGEINIVSGKSIYPYARLVDMEGEPTIIQKDYRSSFTDTVGSGRLLDWKYNPITERDNLSFENMNRHILLQTGIKYKWNAYLNTEAKYQFENSNGNSENYYSPSSYYARNLVNLYSQSSGTSLIRNIPTGGVVDLSNSSIISHAVRVQTNVNANLKSGHEIAGIIGGEIRQAKRTSNSTRAYGYDREILSYSNVNHNISYPTYNNLRGTNFIPNNLSFNSLLDKFVSFYSSANYSYLEKYIFSMSIRKDASNLFGVATNDKWKPLWSVGGAWNLHNEKFLERSKISVLKLRYTYGFSGNVNNSIAATVTIQQQNPLASSLNGLPFARIINRPNPELRWETVKTSNIGIDFRSFSDRLSVSLDLYNKKSYDLLSLVPVDITTTGTNEIIKNSSILNSNGIDISVTTVNLKQAVEWKTNFLFSFNETVVKDYFKIPTYPAAHVNSGATITPVKGELAYNIITYKWAGLNPENGNPRGYFQERISEDYTQIISTASWDDLELHGSSIPLFYGSLRNEITFKNLSLSMNILYRFKYYYLRNSINYSSLFTSWGGHTDYNKRWQVPGDERTTAIPSMTYPANQRRDQFYSQSSILIDRADNIKLQDIRISYDFRNISQKLKNSLQIYFYANNLGIIWRKNKHKDDPDTGNNVYLPSSYSFGCNINF